MKKIVTVFCMCLLALGVTFSQAHALGKGQRIENRMDRKSDRIDRGLDAKGDRIDARLDRRADRAEAIGTERGQKLPTIQKEALF
jgi:hypothetical protein